MSTIAKSLPQESEGYRQEHFTLMMEEVSSELNICMLKHRATAKVNNRVQKAIVYN